VTDLRELQRLEHVFSRAPSAHNTQPWILRYESDHVALDVDLARWLAASDPTRRDLELSLGAFAEAVLIAAADEEIALRFDGDRFVPAETLYETAFTSADLEHRRTSRLPYEPGRIADLAAARAQLRDGETLHELSARDVVALFSRADRHVYETPPVVEELRAWLRLDPRDPRYTEDGLNAECLDLSRLEARALALALALRPRALPFARRALTSASARVLRSDHSILVLEGSPDAVRESGRSLLRVWLALDRAGYRTHPLSQLIDSEETADALAGVLDVPRERLLAIFRAGTSPEPPRSHRLPQGRVGAAGIEPDRALTH
jgi:nitroreductase